MLTLSVWTPAESNSAPLLFVFSKSEQKERAEWDIHAYIYKSMHNMPWEEEQREPKIDVTAASDTAECSSSNHPNDSDRLIRQYK